MWRSDRIRTACERHSEARVIPIITAIACLGGMTWLEPASAQQTKTYFVTVGQYKTLKLKDSDVSKILREASKVLAKCKVALKLKGPVGTFDSPDPPVIKDAATRDAVHKVNFDVKIVPNALDFCRVEAMQEGCAWDPPPNMPPDKERPRYKSIIVADMPMQDAGKIWAHEFGHMTGLPHRNDPNALMACSVENAGINKDECNCFRGGPGSCPRDDPEPPTQCRMR